MFYERSGLHLFTAFGIDVAVSLWYMILMAFIIFSPGLSGGVAAGSAIAHGVVFAIAVTFSLLVHEYGHGVVSKHYDLDPKILLHGFGGLCAHKPASSDGKDALILFAGPGAGLLFGAVAIALHQFLVPVVPSRFFGVFIRDLIWVNIVWSLANVLLPIWPLDGGKLFHLMLRRFVDESSARTYALRISLGTTLIAGVAAFAVTQSLFLGILAFFLFMNNMRALRSGQSLVDRPAASSEPSDFQQDLIEEAEEALEAERWDEAYRLCHQLRSSGGNLSGSLLERIWEVLAVSATRLGKLDEAETYLERAPDTPRVERAREEWRTASSTPDEEAA